MKLFSLEEMAERWTFAHTIAVAAWVVVLVLGVLLFVRNTTGGYPVTDKMMVYAAENATFTYPENWTINNCEPDEPFIELPGTIKTDYKGQKAYKLTIYGTGAFNCVRDRPERLDLYPEQIVASDNPCAPGTSTQGERLQNGLYLQLQEFDDEVTAVFIKQNTCYAPPDTAVLAFSFADPNSEPGDTAEYGRPSVPKESFLGSPQYKDIRALAESIRY
jgi:hypothetical protein